MSGVLTGLLLAHVALVVAAGWSRFAGWFMGPGVEHQVQRFVLVAVLVVPFLTLGSPVQAPWSPPAQVFTEPVMNGFNFEIRPTAPASVVPGVKVTASATGIQFVAVGIAVLTGLFALWTTLSWASVWRLVGTSRLWRRRGSLEIRVSDDVATPFAVWRPGRAVIVVDAVTFANREQREHALLHELQHFRQLDPHVAALTGLVRVVFAINPVMHLWARRIAEVDELACDSALVSSERVGAASYARSLLAVAERAMAQRRRLSSSVVPSPAVGLSAAARRSLLSRRLHRLTERVVVRSAVPSTLVGLALVIGTATASESLVGDSGHHATDLSSILSQACYHGDLHIPTEDVIALAMHRMTQTKEGRAFLRDGLGRRGDYAELVDVALAEYGLPRELAAVPLVESGYANLGLETGDSLAPGVGGAGVWMFIAPTARHYGLTVDEINDERLDPELETDAAMRFFVDLYNEFDDWGLALAAYNQGPGKVRHAIAVEGTSDVWELTRRGALNQYAATVMATVLVMEHPSLVEGW